MKEGISKWMENKISRIKCLISHFHKINILTGHPSLCSSFGFEEYIGDQQKNLEYSKI